MQEEHADLERMFFQLTQGQFAGGPGYPPPGYPPQPQYQGPPPGYAPQQQQYQQGPPSGPQQQQGWGGPQQ